MSDILPNTAQNMPPNIPQIQKTIQDLCNELEAAKTDFQRARNNYNNLSTKVRTHPNFDYKIHGDCVNNLTRDGMTKAYATERTKNMTDGARNILSSLFKRSDKR